MHATDIKSENTVVSRWQLALRRLPLFISTKTDVMTHSTIIYDETKNSYSTQKQIRAFGFES